MRTAMLVMMAGILAAGSCGCTTVYAPVVPPTGFVYSNIKAPLDVDYKDTVLVGKKGEASTKEVLGFAWGDASIEAAAKSSGIKTIDHADYRYVNVLFGIYQKYTTIVYGE